MAGTRKYAHWLWACRSRSEQESTVVVLCVQKQIELECWQSQHPDEPLKSELWGERPRRIHFHSHFTAELFCDFPGPSGAASVMAEEKELSYKEAIEKASSSITRFPLIPIRGIPLMCHIANNWDSIWAFRPDPSDLLIATYPKAGTASRHKRGKNLL